MGQACQRTGWAASVSNPPRANGIPLGTLPGEPGLACQALRSFLFFCSGKTSAPVGRFTGKSRSAEGPGKPFPSRRTLGARPFPAGHWHIQQQHAHYTPEKVDYSVRECSDPSVCHGRCSQVTKMMTKDSRRDIMMKYKHLIGNKPIGPPSVSPLEKSAPGHPFL